MDSLCNKDACVGGLRVTFATSMLLRGVSDAAKTYARKCTCERKRLLANAHLSLGRPSKITLVVVGKPITTVEWARL